jgi:hypothetical protein
VRKVQIPVEKDRKQYIYPICQLVPLSHQWLNTDLVLSDCLCIELLHWIGISDWYDYTFCAFWFIIIYVYDIDMSFDCIALYCAANAPEFF